MDSEKAKELSNTRDLAASYSQKIETINRITTTLDQALTDARQAMVDIKSIVDSVPQEPVTDCEEKIFKFLETECPNYLLPDMTTVDHYSDQDRDDMIASMRTCVEEIMKKISREEEKSLPQPKVASYEMLSLELTPYVENLTQLSKQLENIKLNIKHEEHKDILLEDKLGPLFQDIQTLIQVMQTNTKIYETNENHKEPKRDDSQMVDYCLILKNLDASLIEIRCHLQETYCTKLRQNESS